MVLSMAEYTMTTIQPYDLGLLSTLPPLTHVILKLWFDAAAGAGSEPS
jgi:hypothetical protein